MRATCLTLLCACTLAAAQPQNMVTNGSFEQLQDGLPTGWRVAEEVATMQTGGAPEGERWLRLARPEGASHALARQRVHVKPDTGYRLRAYLRAPKASYYSLVAYDAVLNTLAAKSTGWAVIGDWLELKLDFRTRESDSVVQVGLLSFGPEAHWDAVRMWEDESVRIGDLTPTVNELTEPTSHERERGFMIFGRKANDFVPARYAPTRWDCHTPIRGACPPGQFETIVLGVRALRDLEDVRAELIPQDAPLFAHARRPPIDAELLQVGYGRRGLTSQSYERHPLLLLPPQEVDVPAGDVLQYGVRVHVPEGYPLETVLLAMWLYTGDDRTLVQVIVDVPQVRLDPADATFFMYYSDSYLPPEMATAPMQAAYYRDMAEHGMNSVSLYVEPEHDVDGRVEIDLHHNWRYDPDDPRHFLGLAERLAQMREAGLASPDRPLILLSACGSTWGGFREPESVRTLLRMGEELGWPPLLFYVHDEPNTPERVEAVRATYERVYAKVPQARTVTAIGGYGIEQIGELYDVWIASHGSVSEELMARAEREGRELWAYDCRHRGQRPEFDRFICGLWAWRTGIGGLGQWAYYSERALERDEEGRWQLPEAWREWYMIASDQGPIGTVGWEARREGIEDYRVLQTLQRLVAGRQGETASRGRELLAEARRITPIDAFADAPRDHRYIWEFDPAPEATLRHMSDLRLEMLEVIEQLQR
ncbi:MAG: hypothetical protein U9R79_15390 [Armatimonadota bacterium]|nr:hypothetical protein [Armatimonadota bacterium]